MIKAVIFDFDGTIADTISAIREGLNLTMRQFGYPLHSDDAVRSFINRGARELVRRAMPQNLQNDETLLDRVFAQYDKDYEKTYLRTEQAYPGICELIRDLHNNRGIRIGVLSNKQDRLLKDLCRHVLLPDTYDAAQGVMPGSPTKPHRDLSERIARSLGVSLEECVMIGDSDVDFLTAKNAGMQHIGVSWGYRDEDFLRAHGASVIARDVAELSQLLQNMIP